MQVMNSLFSIGLNSQTLRTIWFGGPTAPKPYAQYGLEAQRRPNLTHNMISRPRGAETLRTIWFGDPESPKTRKVTAGYQPPAQKYSYLKQLSTHNILEVKIQKTKIGEGYHHWHCENAAMKARNRILAFMIYLNDVDEGGETEFLYQKCRFKPEKNTLLVWPSQFTHIHRGNPPLSNDKYIITGWVEYGY